MTGKTGLTSMGASLPPFTYQSVRPIMFQSVLDLSGPANNSPWSEMTKRVFASASDLLQEEPVHSYTFDFERELASDDPSSREGTDDKQEMLDVDLLEDTVPRSWIICDRIGVDREVAVRLLDNAPIYLRMLNMASDGYDVALLCRIGKNLTNRGYSAGITLPPAWTLFQHTKRVHTGYRYQESSQDFWVPDSNDIHYHQFGGCYPEDARFDFRLVITGKEGWVPQKAAQRSVEALGLLLTDRDLFRFVLPIWFEYSKLSRVTTASIAAYLRCLGL